MAAVIAWVAANWVAILKVMALVATGVALGFTVARYIQTLYQPQVAYAFEATAQLIPLAVNFMVISLMFQMIGVVRELTTSVLRGRE